MVCKAKRAGQTMIIFFNPFNVVSTTRVQCVNTRTNESFSLYDLTLCVSTSDIYTAIHETNLSQQQLSEFLQVNEPQQISWRKSCYWDWSHHWQMEQNLIWLRLRFRYLISSLRHQSIATRVVWFRQLHKPQLISWTVSSYWDWSHQWKMKRYLTWPNNVRLRFRCLFSSSRNQLTETRVFRFRQPNEPQANSYRKLCHGDWRIRPSMENIEPGRKLELRLIKGTATPALNEDARQEDSSTL